MLVFTRLSGMMQTAPFISTIKPPVMAKVWFGAAIAFILYPIVLTSKTYIMPRNMTEFMILIAFEFMIGYLIGFVAK